MEKILSEVRLGRPVVIIDDSDREDEADVMLAAERATSETLAFFIREARGLMCIPCRGDILDSLMVPMMVEVSTDKQGTPFTVSVDASDPEMTTGMPVAERLVTIGKFLDPDPKPESLVRPGHMFPLRAKPGLLNDRRGHTEASVQLCILAGLAPVAVISEIISDEGTMVRGHNVREWADQRGLAVVSVQEIYESAQSV
jgi:3,4-dihydroxy-2-butanone 4-phosphate synthase